MGNQTKVIEKQEKDEGSGERSFLQRVFSCGGEIIVALVFGVAFCALTVLADTFVGGVITTLANYFVFVFRLLTLQLSSDVPAILVAFVYYPLTIMIGWLGWRNLRGVSS